MNIVVGLTGLSSSGKTEIANYLEKYEKYEVIRLGKHLREMYSLDEKCEGSIEDYAEKFRFYSVGNYLHADIEKYQNEGKIVVIDSLRTVADYEYFNKYADKFIMIMIVADRARRLEWISNRRRMGDGKTFWQFQSHDYWEMSYGLDKLMVLSDLFVVNDGEIEELLRKIDKQIKSII